MFRTLQSLRGLFAIAIFMHHFCGFTAGGDLGVSFFLILSGFVLCKGFEDRFMHATVTYSGFISGRLSKIYPLHVLCLAAAIAVQWPVLTSADILPEISNLLLLQAWIPDSAYYFSGNSVSWFLSALLPCYLLFPALAGVPARIGMRGMASGLCALLAVYFLALQLVPDDMTRSLIYVFPPMRLVDFLLGMFLWQLWRRACGSHAASALYSQSYVLRTIVEAAAIGIFTGAILLYSHIPTQYASAALWWGPSMLLIIIFTALDRRGGLLTKLLQLRPLVCFGNVSFSFYMIHVLGGEYLRVLFEKFGFAISHTAFVWILLALTAGGAVLINRLFEKPAADLWRRYFCR